MSQAPSVTHFNRPLEVGRAHVASYNLPAVLVILDGFGLSQPGEGNAISLARTPYIDRLMQRCPHTTLGASGNDVGLPQGQMGNSEVGHLNIGAGRIVYQELTRIDRAIEEKTLASNASLVTALKRAKCETSTVHLMGLVSDGGVHSHINHGVELANLAASYGCNVMIHAFTDGRDCDPSSGKRFLQQLQEACNKISSVHGVSAQIATVSGRYYAMDRDNRWERIQQAYEALVHADAPKVSSVESLMDESYNNQVFDEFIVPHVLENTTHPYAGMKPNDLVIFFNFRPDRARQLTRALIDPAFEGFGRINHPQIHLLTLTEYDPLFASAFGATVIFEKELPSNVLADVLAEAGLLQYHSAETEKYAHVTFFLNGGKEELKPGETRVLIDSPKVATYDLQPEMSAVEVTDTLIAAIEAHASDVYIVNYANCDMVGHTGNKQAAIQAVEAVDASLSRLIHAIVDQGGFALITADHGNADCMIDPHDPSHSKPFTAHTLARVPLILADQRIEREVETDVSLVQEDEITPAPRLSDIAPTFVELIGLKPPASWSGRSLIRKLHKSC